MKGTATDRVRLQLLAGAPLAIPDGVTPRVRRGIEVAQALGSQLLPAV